jgi:hypothetical protein
MNNLYEKFKKQIASWQKNGVPILFWRDEQKKSPSVSLTMMLISFILCVLSVIGKFTRIAEGVDVENSMQLLIITSSLYFGRSFSKKMQSEKQEDE